MSEVANKENTEEFGNKMHFSGKAASYLLQNIPDIFKVESDNSFDVDYRSLAQMSRNITTKSVVLHGLMLQLYEFSFANLDKSKVNYAVSTDFETTESNFLVKTLAESGGVSIVEAKNQYKQYLIDEKIIDDLPTLDDYDSIAASYLRRFRKEDFPVLRDSLIFIDKYASLVRIFDEDSSVQREANTLELAVQFCFGKFRDAFPDIYKGDSGKIALSSMSRHPFFNSVKSGKSSGGDKV